MQISEQLSSRIKATLFFIALYAPLYALSATWQDIEYLTSETFPTVWLAWVQLLQGLFLGLAILMGALALMVYVKDNQQYTIPVQEEPAKEV